MADARPWWRQAAGQPRWFGTANAAARQHPWRTAVGLSLPIPIGFLLETHFISDGSWAISILLAAGLAVLTLAVEVPLWMGRRTDR